MDHAPALTRADGSPLRLLVVDDEVNLAELIAMALRYEGWQVSMAHTGSRAVAVAKEQRPDAVVLDIILPDFDGLEVLRSALHGYGTPYAHLLDAVCLTLPAVDAGTAERFAALLAQGPPQETVGLDRPLLPFPTTRPAEVPA